MMKTREVRRSLADPDLGRTDWDRIRSMTDEQIAAAVDADADAAPILTAEMLKAAIRPVLAKEQITLRLDADVLEYFRSQGVRYQTRINAVLRAFVEQSKRSA